MGIQTLGLNCYPQIANLYKELNQDERAIDPSHPDFIEPLFNASLQALKAPEKFQSSPAEIMRGVELMRESF